MVPSADSPSNKSLSRGIVPTVLDGFPAMGKQSYTSSLTSFGVSFHLSANCPDLLQESLAYLPLGSRQSASQKPDVQYSLLLQSQTSPETELRYRLRRNGRHILSSVDRQEFLEHFHSTVTLDVAERSRQRTFIHAGVVGWGGSAIVIPGRSFTGKTTLVAELIRAGASYYSDEFALVDKRGWVHPYARPLQVRESGGNQQTWRPVDYFGAICGHKPLPVKLILATRFKPGAQWRPRPLSPGIGLLQLLDNTVSARRWPAIALQNLKPMALNATIVRGARGEAAQLVEWIAAQFGPAAARGGR